MKNIDATTGKIIPERKKKRGGRQNQNQPPTTIDGGEGDIHQKWCHLIHFQGWNSRHDKWMCETNVFHDTPENRVRVGNNSANSKVVKTAVPSSSSKKQPKKNEEKTKKKITKKRGRSKDVNDDEEDEDMDARTIYQNNLQLITEACTLPFTLQTKLVDDHDKITKPVYPPPSFNNNNDSDIQVRNRKGITMLHEIPSSMNIIDVIQEYLNEKKREDVEGFANAQQENDGGDKKKKSKNSDGKGNQTVSTSDINDNVQTIATKAELKLRKKKRKRFAGNLVSLVDLSLPLYLLYKEEQEQFATYISDQGGNADNEDVDGKDETTVNDKKRPSAMYGGEHLLRFFIKLPFILSQYDPTKKTEESSYILTSKEESQEFAERISELIIFLQKNLECFKGKYIAVEC